MRGVLNGQSGGLKIDGIESNCTVAEGESVKRGDFIELFRSPVDTSPTTITSVLGASFTLGQFLIEKIADNKFFFVYYNATDTYIYADVLQRNEDGTLVRAATAPVKLDNYGGNTLVFLERISDSKVILQFNYSSQDRKYKVLSFDGSNIYVGNTFAFSNYNYTPTAALGYDSTHIITFFNVGASAYMNVLTLSGNNIVASSAYILINSSAAIQCIHPKLLPNGKVLVIGNRSNYIVGFYLNLDVSTVTLTMLTAEVTLKYIGSIGTYPAFYLKDNLFYYFNFNNTAGTFDCHKITYDADALTVAFVETESIRNKTNSSTLYMSQFSGTKVSDKKMILGYLATVSGYGYPEYILYDISLGTLREEYTCRLLNTTLGSGPRYFVPNEDFPKNISAFYNISSTQYSKPVKIAEYGRKSTMNEKSHGISKGNAETGEIFKMISIDGGF
jgi:hypothetical protein